MAEKRSMIAQEIEIPVGAVKLNGLLQIPPEARGLVISVQGCDTLYNSPRNQLLASFLQDGSIATLLLDLLTQEEGRDDMMMRELRFNIPFLIERLTGATDWISRHEETHQLPIGYFGASTGAAAALSVAGERGDAIKAIVCRGGRVDLVGQSLAKVQAPTLLIVGASDYGVVELNERVLGLLSCKKRLEIIPEASHQFEERGALEEVGRMATLWFQNHL